MPGRQIALERETQCRWSMVPTPSEGMAAGDWESDRAIRALKPGNADRAKGPDFRRAVEEAAEGDIGESLFKPHTDPKVSKAALSPGEAVAETTAWTRRRSRPESPVREIRTPGLMSGDGKRDHELHAQSTRAHPRLYFGYPGTGTVADPELRCNGFCLPVAFNPPFTPARASNAARRSRSGSPGGHATIPLRRCPAATPQLRPLRARRFSLPAQVAPRSAAACRRTACGSDALRPARASSSEHA